MRHPTSAPYPSALVLMSLLTLTACHRKQWSKGVAKSAESTSSAVSAGTPSGDAIETDAGPVRGVVQGDIVAYLGIPYAAPPVGAKRFLPPDPPEHWSAPRDANAWGACCPQLTQGGEFTGSEDCLTLNVWAPKERGTTAKPVLVFIHGGGNIQGCSAQQGMTQRIYEGDVLASKRGVIVVTFNYRLNVLGFLAHAALKKANLGLRDQTAALEWVHRNIKAFGGDPERVLLFGESAGAEDTCAHLVSPASKGLFSRALMESAICPFTPLEKSQKNGEDVAKKLGCTDDDPFACLRGKSAEELVKGAPGSTLFEKGIKYGPSVDGDVIVSQPLATIASGGHNHVPFVIGDNSEETRLWMGKALIPGEGIYRARVTELLGATKADEVLKRYPVSDYPDAKTAFIAATTDAVFVCPARALARALAKGQSEPVYRYLFAHAPHPKFREAAHGAAHGLELLFVFGHLHPAGYQPTSAEQSLSDTMMSYWSGFAAKGDPNGADLPAWPKFEPASDPYLELNDAVVSKAGLRTANCDFWDGALPLAP